MRRYNPTRRGNIETGGCKCGWSVKRQCYVANGCKLHPRRTHRIRMKSYLEEKARRFATAAHESIDHRRKYTGEPYIVHPAAVVELVRGVPHTDAMLAAAWLHDTVEDTPITLADIEREFGMEVASLVEQLTDVSKPVDGNRRLRKEIERAHTAKASPPAKTIKLADLIDNARSILARDQSFAVVFLAEKRSLLEVLGDGDATLMSIAARIAYGEAPPQR